ncbi:TPA: hypothetical protein MYR09_002372 [Citrobacter farmeri]|uniref:hypothetical protein n=1 Tax=Citrobacter farmeri TaxID=67824 RepID=UPI00388D0863|nr:hypothetical protein [Citrobacter farmeri]
MSGKRENQERMARQAMTTVPLKIRLSALFLFVCITAATVFIFTVGGSELVDILHKKKLFTMTGRLYHFSFGSRHFFMLIFLSFP